MLHLISFCCKVDATGNHLSSFPITVIFLWFTSISSVLMLYFVTLFLLISNVLYVHIGTIDYKDFLTMMLGKKNSILKL